MSRVRSAPWALMLVILGVAPAAAQDAPAPREVPEPPPAPAAPPVVIQAAPVAAEAEVAAPVGVAADGLVLRVGIAGIVLPEASGGTFSAQPELRIGWFTGVDMAVQVEASARVWPLGGVSAKSYGVAGNILWFPPLAGEQRDFYLLGGGGSYYSDPVLGDSSFDPVVRGGVGMLASLASLIPSAASVRLAVEYRGELLLADDTDFVSGIALGLSRNL